MLCSEPMCSRVAVPSPPPQGETEARERLSKPDTNRVSRRHSNACKLMSLDNIFCEVLGK